MILGEREKCSQAKNIEQGDTGSPSNQKNEVRRFTSLEDKMVVANVRK